MQVQGQPELPKVRVRRCTARAIRQTVLPEFAWHRNHYEHIIRDGDSLNRVREYIAGNPAQWNHDREHPLAETYGPQVE